VDAIPEYPALWVRGGAGLIRARPQLSGPGRTPRHPKARSKVTDNLAPARLDTLVDDSQADETSRDADLLSMDYHNLLVVEQLLSDDRGKAAEHVVARVHHDALGTHARAGHPSRRYPCS
jgi:hypothetical protein